MSYLCRGVDRVVEFSYVGYGMGERHIMVSNSSLVFHDRCISEWGMGLLAFALGSVTAASVDQIGMDMFLTTLQDCTHLPF